MHKMKELIKDDFVDENGFYHNLILNDYPNNDQNFNSKCLAMYNSINSLEQSHIDFLFRIIVDPNINSLDFVFPMYENFKKGKISFPEKEAIINLLELYNNLDLYTKNEKILEIISDRVIKSACVINCDNLSYDIRETISIRIIKYYLKNNQFRKYGFFVDMYFGIEVTNVFVEIYSDKIKEIINSNKNNPDILYIITNLTENNIYNFFTNDLLVLLENISYQLAIHLIDEDIPKKYIMNDYFKNAFKKFSFGEQLFVLERLVDHEYPTNFINELHSMLNKNNTQNDISPIELIFETNETQFENVHRMIINSSYFNRNNITDSELWKLITSILNNELTSDFRDLNLYKQLMELYGKCWEHATTSIINSLYPLNTLTDKITYLKNIRYNILTVGFSPLALEKIEDLFDNQYFACGNILSEGNFSHPGDYRCFWGFYTNITPHSIAHIFPGELVQPYTCYKYRKNIARPGALPLLLDIDHLREFTIKNKTFSSVYFKTTTDNNQPILPDCIVCLDDVNNEILNLSEKYNKKILVLKRNSNTIENNEVRCYRGCAEVGF